MTRRFLTFAAHCGAILSLGSSLLWASNGSIQVASPVIDRVSAQVSAYLDRLADVKCTENVLQEKLTPGGKVERREISTFDYLIMLSGSSDEMSLSESRLTQSTAKRPNNTPLLVTNGFSTLFLVFHPYYRNAFRFTDIGEEVIDSQRLTRIRFEHLPGHRTPIALSLRGREYPLDIVGTAYVDPTTATIVRIESGLASPIEDLGLKVMNASVVYSPVRLPGAEQTGRFPSSATVEVETRKQHWRNTHRFSNYKEFSVSTEVKVSDEIGNTKQ